MKHVEPRATANVDAMTLHTIEHIHQAWNDALERKDAEAASALYAPDTILESPLVRHLLKCEDGVVHGREKVREFLKQVFAHTPASRHVQSTGFFTDGRTVMWEHPHTTPEGDQMDFVEVMCIDDGLIQHHRVYWGWFGVRVLDQDRHLH
jgi:hypothetical protein